MTKNNSKNKDRQIPKMVNKKAFYNYEIVEKVEAGIELKGTEVKSLRAGQADLDAAFARIINGQCWLIGCKIAPYAQANIHNHDPDRNKKLLLHRAQIKKIETRISQQGFTLVPLRIYFNGRGYAKVELGIAHGKRQYDKRKKITARQHKKDIENDTKKYRR